MSWNDLGTIAITFLASLGGVGAIVFGLSNWIGKIFADKYLERAKHEIQRDVESYKTQLKKSEFLYQKEFEAASQFIAMRRSLLPPYRFREMIWDEACEEFADNFSVAKESLDA